MSHTSERSRDDVLRVAGRRALFLGMFLSSFLVFRLPGGLTVGDLVVLGSLYLAALSLDRRPSRPSASAAGWLCVTTLLLFGGILSCLHAVSTGGNLLVVARLTYVVVILPWHFKLLLNSEALVKRGILWWLAGCAACSLGTVLQYLLGANVIPNTEVTNVGRYTGFAQHVSDTGGITSVAIVFGVAGLATATSSSQRGVVIAVISASTIGLLLSGSVSGLVAVGAGLLALLIRRGLPMRYLFAIVGVAATSMWVVARIQANTLNVLTPWERILQTTGLSESVVYRQYNTTTTRIESDIIGWNGFIQHPFTGVSFYPSLEAIDPHNLFIGVAYRGGIFPLLGVLLVVFVSIKVTFPRLPCNALPDQIFAGLVAAVSFAMTSPNLYSRYFWFPVAFSFAVFALRSRGMLVRKPEYDTSPPAATRMAEAGASMPGQPVARRT
jgi:hypothetical protein